MEGDNLYDKIQEIFGSIPSNFSILEEKINIDLQMEYFEYSRRMKLSLLPEDVMRKMPRLFQTLTTSDEKRKLLVQLASIENVEAYRAIEQYVSNPDEGLREWAILALQESRMLLESKLLDENQVFISTGLGGKGTKLRYFVALIGREETEFNEVQQKLIHNEVEFVLKKYHSELEETSFGGHLASIVAVVSLKEPIKDIFKEAIDECNQYGNFLSQNFIVTNVKVLSFDEIREFLNSQKNKKEHTDEA